MANEETRTLVTFSEEDDISRSVLIWLNQYPDIPPGIIGHETLLPDVEGMVMSVIPGTYITARYITGGHRAEYQFAIVYRIKPGNSIDKRLTAEKILNNIGDWCSKNPPTLGTGINTLNIEPTTRAALMMPYENGDEDYQIIMRLRYEVI